MILAPVLLCAGLWAAPASTAAVKTAFLLHGILNAPVSLRRIETALERRGFAVVNLDYPSRSRTVEEHAAWLDQQVRARGRGELYFVGHSLGSIVIRYYLARYRPEAARRFVMIAPPNHGSLMADKVHQTGLYRLVWGDHSGAELRASNAHFWTDLPPPPIEFGIIAGGRGGPRGFNPLIPGDNDGTLAVAETRLPGARDFVLLPYQHTGIVLRKATAERVVRFLETGRF